MSFVILTAPDCSWCDKAKSLIKANGHSYVEFDITTNPALREFMTANLLTTVPQVFMAGERVGGYNKLFEHYERKHDIS